MLVEIKRVDSKEELEICKSVRKGVFTDEQNIPVEIEADQYDNLNSNVVHFLICSESEGIGTSRYVILSDGKAQLQRLAIKKSFRNQGYARKLINFIEEYAQQNGINYLELHAQYHAKGFYEKLGYLPISEKYIEEGIGIEHINMAKKLKRNELG